MKPLDSSAPRREGRLWVISLGLSLLVNAAILAFAGFVSLKSQIYRKSHPLPVSPPAVTTVTIIPQFATAAQSSPESPPSIHGKPSYVRTSQEQASAPPENTGSFGERDTRATSDQPPVATALPLPSQAGAPQKNREDLETTRSDYQDGGTVGERIVKPQDPSPPTVSAAALADHPSASEKTGTPGTDPSKSPPPGARHLMAGPNPVDVPVPRELAEKTLIPPSPQKLPQPADVPKPPVRQAAKDPAFQGYQRKTAMVGSISRNGRSALDVTDSPLGRYQAVISRAVEQEWQRNCVRHRDFITPGFLTVRFFVEPTGKVRTVQFVGDMVTGEVQKGFTLNSIRDAEIPAMPPAVKKDYAKEPLELIFNFYF